MTCAIVDNTLAFVKKLQSIDDLKLSVKDVSNEELSQQQQCDPTTRK
jgi:hypothetical protein